MMRGAAKRPSAPLSFHNIHSPLLPLHSGRISQSHLSFANPIFLIIQHSPEVAILSFIILCSFCRPHSHQSLFSGELSGFMEMRQTFIPPPPPVPSSIFVYSINSLIRWNNSLAFSVSRLPLCSSLLGNLERMIPAYFRPREGRGMGIRSILVCFHLYRGQQNMLCLGVPTSFLPDQPIRVLVAHRLHLPSLDIHSPIFPAPPSGSGIVPCLRSSAYLLLNDTGEIKMNLPRALPAE